jgi:hypothetical protein
MILFLVLRAAQEHPNLGDDLGVTVSTMGDDLGVIISTPINVAYAVNKVLLNIISLQCLLLPP